MHHVVLAILLVLGLPQVAAAAPLGVRAEPVLTDGAPLERAAVPAAPAPGVDLRIDGVQPGLPADEPDGAGATEAERAQRDLAADEPRSDRGLSFGFEIRPRSRLGALARQDDIEDPGLGDQLQRLIERPVFGLRGRYRF